MAYGNPASHAKWATCVAELIAQPWRDAAVAAWEGSYARYLNLLDSGQDDEADAVICTANKKLQTVMGNHLTPGA